MHVGVLWLIISLPVKGAELQADLPRADEGPPHSMVVVHQVILIIVQSLIVADKTIERAIWGGDKTIERVIWGRRQND